MDTHCMGLPLAILCFASVGVSLAMIHLPQTGPDINSYNPPIVGNPEQIPTIASAEKLVESKNGDWFLIYRAKSGNGRQVAATYLTSYGTNEKNAWSGCVSTFGDAECNGNYRHSCIDRWTSLGVSKVKVELYKNGLAEATVVFKGRNTTYMTWFQRENILTSTWSGIEESHSATCEMFGAHIAEKVNRRFSIIDKAASCPDYSGWMTVVEANDEDCNKKLGPDFPIFLITPQSGPVTFEKKSKQAEVLAIYIKADNIPPEQCK